MANESHRGSLTKSHFTEVFKATRESVTTVQNTINAFRRSGLFPLSPTGIDQTKLGPSKWQHLYHHLLLLMLVTVPQQTPMNNEPKLRTAYVSLNTCFRSTSKLCFSDCYQLTCVILCSKSVSMYNCCYSVSTCC